MIISYLEVLNSLKSGKELLKDRCQKILDIAAEFGPRNYPATGIVCSAGDGMVDIETVRRDGAGARFDEYEYLRVPASLFDAATDEGIRMYFLSEKIKRDTDQAIARRAEAAKREHAEREMLFRLKAKYEA